MNKQRIYVDTSVIGGCFDNEFQKWSNALVKDFMTGLYIPVMSEVTSAEIQDAPQNVQSKYFELLTYNSEMLFIDENV